MTFDHILITRFNLKLWEQDKNHTDTRTDEWMRERFDLFEHYCLPAVAQQSCQQFTWLVLFADDTKAEFRQRIGQCQTVCPRLQPLFLTDEQMLDHKNFVRQYVFEHTAAEHVLTTSLDNDDAIHRDFIATLQQSAKEQAEEGLYTLVDGYQLFVKQKLLLRMHYPHNHFLSLLEKRAPEMVTVFSFRHARARKTVKRLFDIKKQPLWLEVVHPHNVRNDLRITSRVHYKCVWNEFSLSDFGIDQVLTAGSNWRNNLLRFPALWLKTAVVRLGKKIGKKHDD